MDTNKQVFIFGAIVLTLFSYYFGYSTPRTSWEKKLVPVEYDVFKNTGACEAAGGYIIPATVIETGKQTYYRFTCYIPAKTVELNDEN